MDTNIDKFPKLEARISFIQVFFLHFLMTRKCEFFEVMYKWVRNAEYRRYMFRRQKKN